MIKNISRENFKSIASKDLINGLIRYPLWWDFALHEIRKKFRRSVIGPFWITLSLSIMTATLCFLGGRLFKKNPSEVVPLLSTGLIMWTLFSSIISEGANVFISAGSTIKNVAIPISSHFYRCVARNLLSWCYNMAIYVVVIVVFPPEKGFLNIVFFPIGFFLFLMSASSLAMMISVLSTRFRDVPQIIASIMQILFFVTPIFWSIDTMNAKPSFVTWNPLYHLFEVSRKPLIGQSPGMDSWGISVSIAIVSFTMAVVLYRRYFSRIPYWA